MVCFLLTKGGTVLSIFTVYQVVNVFNIIFLAIHVVQGRLGLLALREWFSLGAGKLIANSPMELLISNVL